ncbi:MAG: Lrp/AsnC family transcriptional regulator [Candidatus Aenigmatarchaeota archaeon]
MEEKLTKKEKDVLVELIKNGRITDQEIARRLKTSRPTVFKIRKRLEDKGIIRNYSALVDFEKIGIGIQAVILYMWRDYSKSQELERVIKFIKSLPEVVLFIKGEGLGSKTDLIISVHRDLKEYETFIRKLKYEWKDNVENVEVFISSIDGISKGYDLASPVLAKIREDVISLG